MTNDRRFPVGVATACWKSTVTALKSVPPVFTVIVLVRMLLIITYPLNFMMADGTNFYRMLVRGISNLIHAPGYPFLIGLAWRNPIGWSLIENHPVMFHYLLLLTQHTINVLCLYLAYRVVRGIFGDLSATLFAILYGLNFQVMNVTSSVTPEWLQGSLVMLLGFLLYRAYLSKSLHRKAVLFAACGFVFSWMYLVKFNSVALLSMPVFVGLAECRRRRKAALAVACAIPVAIVIYAAFLVGFHEPSTGTFAITQDKSWILLERLSFFAPQHRLSPSTGIATKRLVVLNNVLPNPEKGGGPIDHMDSVPRSVRAPYRAEFYHLLTADEATLDQILQAIRLPKSTDFSTAYRPVAYCLGLKESNDLGVSVFLENVRRYPAAYFKSVWWLTKRSLTSPKRHWMYPLLPIERLGSQVGWGFFKLRPRSEFDRKPQYRYHHRTLWAPGVGVFTIHYYMSQFPPIWVPLLITFGSLAAILAVIRKRRLGREEFTYLTVSIVTVLFVVFSNMIYHYRWKEVHPVLPLICMLCGVALTWLVRWLAAIDTKWKTSTVAERDEPGTTGQ